MFHIPPGYPLLARCLGLICDGRSLDMATNNARDSLVRLSLGSLSFPVAYIDAGVSTETQDFLRVRASTKSLHIFKLQCLMNFLEVSSLHSLSL
jgi:hypothetical protein